MGQTEKSQRRRIKVLLMTVTCCFLFLGPVWISESSQWPLAIHVTISYWSRFSKPIQVCWTPHHTYQLMTAFESDFSTTGGFIFMLLARFLGKIFRFSSVSFSEKSHSDIKMSYPENLRHWVESGLFLNQFGILNEIKSVLTS